MPHQLKSNPKVVKLLDAGRKAAERGNLRLAVSSFNAALAIAPHCAFALFYRAQLRMLVGDSARARADFRAMEALPVESLVDYKELDNLPAAKFPALERGAGGAGAPAWEWALKSFLLRSEMKNDEAVAAMKRAAAAAPKNAALRAFLGRVRVIYRFPDEGAEDLAKAARMAPACGWIRAWLGEARRRQGRMQSALKDINAAVRLRRGYALAHVWRGAVLAALGKPKCALLDFDTALEDLGDYFRIEDDRTSFVNYTLGWTLNQRSLVRRKTGDLLGALEDLARANQINSRYQWVDPLSPSPEALRLGLAELDRLAAAYPKDARVLAWRGLTRLSAGRAAEALKDLDLAVRRAPRSAFARLWRGRALSALERTEEALEEFAAACRLDKGNAEAHAWRGGMLRALSRYAAADKALSASLALDSISAWTYAWRGENRFVRGKLGEAEADLSRALAIYPGFAQAYVWRGRVLLAGRRSGEAAGDFKKALELDPHNADAKRLLGACK